MSSPLKTILRFGRWSLRYWHGWRFWSWLPRRTSHWYGELVHWRWLCFEIGIDRRTDVLGDWMGKREQGGEGDE